MPKKKKLLSAKWIAIIILVAIIALSSVATAMYIENKSKPIIAAVHAGDTFYYSVTGAYIVFSAGTNPDEMSPGITELNQTAYYKVTITNVEGSVVSLTDDWVFVNGTDIHDNQTINVANGNLGDKDGFWGIYAPNLAVGNLLCPKGGDSGLKVDTAFTQTYSSGKRQTNYWSIESNFTDTLDPTGSTAQQNTIDVCFDKQTGIMTAMTNFVQYNNPQMNTAVTWTLTKCTLWQV
jgi:hypothetical protein